jgi:rhodanese-related sulfurtransferase
MDPAMKRPLIQPLILVGLATVLGLLLNATYVLEVFQPTPELEVKVVGEYLPIPVEIADVEAWWQERGVIVDARSEAAFAEGHVPTAHSVPRGDRRALSKMVDCCLSDKVLVYCSGEQCDDSFIVGEELFRIGFRQVMIYEAGFGEWQSSGRPIERGAP